MLEIKVTIEAAGLSQVISQLADAIKSHPGTTSNLVISPEKAVENMVDVIPAVKNDSQAASATVESVQPVQTNVQPVTQNAGAATQQQFMNPPVTAATPALDLDTISRAGAALIDQGRTKDILALLAQFGVPAVNLLDPSQYQAFADGLRALGANI